ncbi:2-amino-4-hydroxy-6-hydroxymethyldihydropteridine diphosphokinase [Cnuibacter physcomitrellae]|uniref:2-amino-4-hydroxy-6-hydroxymethyldihydropteridine diphosphokinase n=1 Tax=Cnuibacter physcomitrellae TaxID=1619308 RepID=A0A1X9LN10_9MICO|nr:2-amino-4-hydroxy-6-hydroxymethyldihydropteridine diphosphokinase [Cnuibacter physcomitrellae]ARJ04509.1 2-amino-4-hydroxy-6-hydroxymethyldihydropteridine diphosphokinase [Cnuibacter physcomitrellae]GGI41218.1 2-amino-4-hydroxy-6-hydroxymethyldihydropteridine diphosphokinase [Cnuibacter physcomitrellae]
MTDSLLVTVPAHPIDAVLAFGSNLGDREATVEAALAALAAAPGVELVAASRLYETVAVKPDGVDHEAPSYLNGVARIRTGLSPLDLLALVHRVEHAHGRVRVERWGDRTLDIDVVLYGDLTSDDATLTLPHPRAHERDFVLVPWLEIDPDAVVPGRGRADELLRGLPTSTLTVYAGERR